MLTSIKKIFSLVGAVFVAILVVILFAGIGYLTLIVGTGFAATLAILGLIIVLWSGIIEHFKNQKRPDD